MSDHVEALLGSVLVNHGKTTLYDGMTIERVTAVGSDASMIRSRASFVEVKLTPFQLALVAALMENEGIVRLPKTKRLGVTVAVDYLALAYQAYNPDRGIIRTRQEEGNVFTKPRRAQAHTTTIDALRDYVNFSESDVAASVMDFACAGCSGRLEAKFPDLLPELKQKVRRMVCARPKCFCEFVVVRGAEMVAKADVDRIKCLREDPDAYFDRFCVMTN